MKILMTLMGLDIGGAETHVVELSKGLTPKGFDVIIASNGGVYEKELGEIKHFKLPLHNKNPLNILKSYQGLLKIIQDEKPDIIHAHARIPAFICEYISKKTKIPMVTTAHWVFSTKWGLKYITKWGKKTIAVSNDIEKYLIDNYKVSDKDIFVTVNGIDTEKFNGQVDFSDIIKEFNLNEKSRNIVYIGRLDPSRDIVAFLLMDIAKELYDKYEDLNIIIVGDGTDFEEFKERANKINLDRKIITLTGARTDINKFTALADVFVGASRAALEAMSAGKPGIIAGNEGYIGIFNESKLKTAITSNFTCRGENMCDKETFKQDILKLLNTSKSELKTLGEFGREVVLKNYSIEKMVTDNVSAYRAVMEDL